MLSHNAGVVPVCYTWIGLALHHPLLFPVLTSTRKSTLSPSNGFERKIKGICLGHVRNGDRTMTQVLKSCKFPESEPTSYPAGGRYPQHWSPGFAGGTAARHLRPLQEKESWRETDCCLLPPCAAQLPWAPKWNQPAKQPGYLAPTAALSTLSPGALIPPPQVWKPDGEEGLGTTAACVPCCLPQQAAPRSRQSPYFTLLEWGGRNSVSCWNRSWPALLSLLFPWQHMATLSVQCLPWDQCLLVPLWKWGIRRLYVQLMNMPKIMKSVSLGPSGTHWSQWHKLDATRAIFPSIWRHFRRDVCQL